MQLRARLEAINTRLPPQLNAEIDAEVESKGRDGTGAQRMSTTAIQTLPAATRDFIPRAFLGMARAFRQRVDNGISTDTDRIITSIISPLRKRLSGNASPVFRSDLLIDTERRWRTELRAFSRVMLQIERWEKALASVAVRTAPIKATFRR